MDQPFTYVNIIHIDLENQSCCDFRIYQSKALNIVLYHRYIWHQVENLLSHINKSFKGYFSFILCLIFIYGNVSIRECNDTIVNTLF